MFSADFSDGHITLVNIYDQVFLKCHCKHRMDEQVVLIDRRLQAVNGVAGKTADLLQLRFIPGSFLL